MDFCQDREAEPIAADDLQAAAGQLELGFERQIRVGHRAGGDHAGTPLSAQFGLKQDRGVGFDLDILEIMQHLVTAAAAVAVDTAVGASGGRGSSRSAARGWIYMLFDDTACPVPPAFSLRKTTSRLFYPQYTTGWQGCPVLLLRKNRK